MALDTHIALGYITNIKYHIPAAIRGPRNLRWRQIVGESCGSFPKKTPRWSQITSVVFSDACSLQHTQDVVTYSLTAELFCHAVSEINTAIFVSSCNKSPAMHPMQEFRWPVQPRWSSWLYPVAFLLRSISAKALHTHSCNAALFTVIASSWTQTVYAEWLFPLTIIPHLFFSDFFLSCSSFFVPCCCCCCCTRLLVCLFIVFCFF